MNQMISRVAELPTHQRVLPEFKDALGADAAHVILGMNQMGDDIPEQRPGYQIALPAVGVQRDSVPVKVYDPFGSQQIVTLSCDVALSTYIPVYKRGIHMSRIGSLLADATGEVYENLQHYASYLATQLNERQYGGPSEVKVSGKFSYLEAVRGWKPEKDKRSLERIYLYASARADHKHVAESAGLKVAHMTACPCVQQTYKHALLQSKGDVEKAIKLTAPLFTHSQRCETEVHIENLPHRFSMKQLLEALDQVLFRTQNTLPREHEVLLVYLSHREPQFIEDAMRQVVATLYNLLKDDVYAHSAIKVHSTSMESIHDFDIAAKYHMTLHELKHLFERTSDLGIHHRNGAGPR